MGRLDDRDVAQPPFPVDGRKSSTTSPLFPLYLIEYGYSGGTCKNALGGIKLIGIVPADHRGGRFAPARASHIIKAENFMGRNDISGDVHGLARVKQEVSRNDAG